MKTALLIFMYCIFLCIHAKLFSFNSVSLQALFTASTLCVFDLLHQRPHLDAAQVAEEVKASVKGTECLLEACVSLGLLNIKARG